MNYVQVSHESNNSIASYAAFFLILVYIGRVQELIPDADKLYLGKIAIAICTIIFIFLNKGNIFSELSFQPVKYSIWIYGIACITFPFSVWSKLSLEFVTDTYFKTMIFFILLVFTTKTYSDIRKVLWGLITSGAILSISLLSKEQGVRKSASTTYDPNDLSFTLIIILPIAYYFFRNRTGLTKLILLSVIALMLTANFGTLSRGGFLGLLTICFAIAVKSGKKFSRSLIIFVLLLSILGFFIPDAYMDRAMTIIKPGDDYNLQISTGRIEIWKRGFNLILMHPIMGVGAGCFTIAEYTINNMKQMMVAHNSFIHIGAELGIIGLGLFIAMIYKSIVSLRTCRNASSGSVPGWLLDALEISFYGYVVSGFFLSQSYAYILYVLIAMTAVIVRISRQEKNTPVVNRQQQMEMIRAEK